MEALDGGTPREDRLEAFLGIHHHFAQPLDDAETVFGIGIEKLVGVVIEYQKTAVGNCPQSLDEMLSDFFGPVCCHSLWDYPDDLAGVAQFLPKGLRDLTIRRSAERLEILHPGIVFTFWMMEFLLHVVQEGGFAYLPSPRDKAT